MPGAQSRVKGKTPEVGAGMESHSWRQRARFLLTGWAEEGVGLGDSTKHMPEGETSELADVLFC